MILLQHTVHYVLTEHESQRVRYIRSLEVTEQVKKISPLLVILEGKKIANALKQVVYLAFT